MKELWNIICYDIIFVSECIYLRTMYFKIWSMCSVYLFTGNNPHLWSLALVVISRFTVMPQFVHCARPNLVAGTPRSQRRRTEICLTCQTQMQDRLMTCTFSSRKASVWLTLAFLAFNFIVIYLAKHSR